MDCGVVDQSTTPTPPHAAQSLSTLHLQQQQQQQQQQHLLQLNSAVLSLDESIQNLNLLADTCGSNTANNNQILHSLSSSLSSAVTTPALSNASPSKVSFQVGQSEGEIITTKSASSDNIVGSVDDSSLSLSGVVKRQHSLLQKTSSSDSSRSHTYRISMANLEETQESELDVILGELSLLEAQIQCDQGNFMPAAGAPGGMMLPPSASSTRTHSRTNSTLSAANSISGSSESGSVTASICSSSGFSEMGTHTGSDSSSSSNSISGSAIMGITGVSMSSGTPLTQSMRTTISTVVPTPTSAMTLLTNGSNNNLNQREPRTESPDNDSAFSDTVSLLSSESSASSGMGSAQQQQQSHHHHHHHHKRLTLQAPLLAVPVPGGIGGTSMGKAAKIQLALHKLESAPIRRLFVKAFTADGASKSLLVDERMTCGHVTRLLADKNHVQMQPQWALIENLGDLQMERLFEDHELLVDNLIAWNSDAGNRVLFQQRSDKVALFMRPELYLPGPQMAPGSQHDEHTRSILVEEFFETNAQIQVDGPLYMKAADTKKGWKRYHFVLRPSGLYYFPKEKTKNPRDLACLTPFHGHNVYRGLGWRKKLKAPTDYTFGLKAISDSSLGKSCRSLKMLCAEDLETMERWLMAIRVAKYGKQLWENYKTLLEELSMAGDGISQSSFAVSMRSESISSISSAVPSQCGSVSSALSGLSSNSSNGGRISRASSSSSSGCLSDDNNGFDSEFTTGTIKRKPSMKPNLPLTNMTRQLKEVGEITQAADSHLQTDLATSPERSGTLTRRHSRRKSQESNGSSSTTNSGGGGTLKRRTSNGVSSGGTSMILSGNLSSGKRGSAESMNAQISSGSSNSTPTPTPSNCNKSLLGMSSSYETTADLPPLPPPPSPLTVLANTGVGHNDALNASTLSLDSLPPPPPPPSQALLEGELDLYGSQMSLMSLPPPPPPPPSPPSQFNKPKESYGLNALDEVDLHQPQSMYNMMMVPPPAITPTKSTVKTTIVPPITVSPGRPLKPALSVKAVPPYKNPPDYKSSLHNNNNSNNNSGVERGSCGPNNAVAPVVKKVSFADSPVLLRRKMHSPEPIHRSHSQQQQGINHHHMKPEPFYAPGPLPPPRTDLMRLSNGSSVSTRLTSSSSSSLDYNCSPKRLQESTSNPPRDFLKDLQRVMRKKWQVAQKCKQEPATTPHEVLGFRDFSADELLGHNSRHANSHYYRETANVSNWVQEHYGAGAPLAPPPPPLMEYALYENLHSGKAISGGRSVATANGLGMVGSVRGAAESVPVNISRKKRPPPPPPKRSDSTHLTSNSHRA